MSVVEDKWRERDEKTKTAGSQTKEKTGFDSVVRMCGSYPEGRVLLCLGIFIPEMNPRSLLSLLRHFDLEFLITLISLVRLMNAQNAKSRHNHTCLMNSWSFVYAWLISLQKWLLESWAGLVCIILTNLHPHASWSSYMPRRVARSSETSRILLRSGPLFVACYCLVSFILEAIS